MFDIIYLFNYAIYLAPDDTIGSINNVTPLCVMQRNENESIVLYNI